MLYLSEEDILVWMNTELARHGESFDYFDISERQGVVTIWSHTKGQSYGRAIDVGPEGVELYERLKRKYPTRFI